MVLSVHGSDAGEWEGAHWGQTLPGTVETPAGVNTYSVWAKKTPVRSVCCYKCKDPSLSPSLPPQWELSWTELTTHVPSDPDPVCAVHAACGPAGLHPSRAVSYLHVNALPVFLLDFTCSLDNIWDIYESVSYSQL
jgi:hypothetical protein